MGVTASRLQAPHDDATVTATAAQLAELNLNDQALHQIPEHLLTDTIMAINLHRNSMFHSRVIIKHTVDISQLPDAMARCVNLVRLSCSNNKITTLPDVIATLRNLEFLDMTHNSLVNISDQMHQLNNLTALGLSDCKLTEIPLAVCNLVNLQKLGLFGNQLTGVPIEICRMRSLCKLDLSDNRITELPETICSLIKMQWLNLASNQLTRLPRDIGRLTELQDLGLGFNQLQELPDLSTLDKLKLLPVYNNKLTKLDAWIGRMNNLEKLDASGNDITDVPAWSFKMKSLKYINIRNNQLLQVHMPHHSQLKSCQLEFCDFAGNASLTSVPLQMLRLTKLRHFRMFKLAQRNSKHMVASKVDSLQHIAADQLLRRHGLHPSHEIVAQVPPHVLYQCSSVIQQCWTCQQPFIIQQHNLHEPVNICHEHDVPTFKYMCSRKCQQDDQKIQRTASTRASWTRIVDAWLRDQSSNSTA